MIDKDKLCEKIMEIYPDIGQCAIDVNVFCSKEQKAWVVHLERDGKKLETYLEDEEINACMDGKQCVSLGVHVSDLSRNIKKI